ncbi:type II 3-dehydroquinate dehydratase [Litorivicinus lipolyticus]|uniref:3-dehydroquinate dehydratase n=1 Tax=Litorivicinus lipolyticus TaxID=418701 RepID=A0A5Q2QFE1_9GAMM|nr:type II 3-dehydroquinate dehydratase [Litorivicinus lipolyticus]QGG81052.1 type II 3-dehydroquinate dehydratase [Litorivicinus lipolyticus]
MARLLLINGPNLNLLGTREPGVYGHRTLANIETDLCAQASAMGHDLACYQSNHEGDLVDRIQQARDEGVAFILINPGAYTHTSVAIRDAFAGVAIPFVEIHLSNIHSREAFRHHSYLSDIAAGVIVGLGELGYQLGLTAAHAKLGSH